MSDAAQPRSPSGTAQRACAAAREGSICPLAAGVVVVVGVFVQAFAAFVLLPLAAGFCTARFFRRQAQRGQSAGWAGLLAGNALAIIFLLSVLFLGFESYYRFGYDQTDAM